jgi:hypothetical protein
MSIQNEEEEISNILDKDNEISPISLNNNDIHEFTNNLGEDEYSPSPFILSDKSRPLFISNENFINYFMHIDYNTPLNRESIDNLKNNILDKKSNSKEEEILSQSFSNLNAPKNDITNKNPEKNSVLSKKWKRQKEFGILTDSKTGITYNEEDDPINYRKAKKRIQNRESALRMKKMRENVSCKLEEEVTHLREDNIRLINENISLKKEKEFLIEQIKFMQKIIKKSNLELKLKNELSDSSDNNSNSSSNEETKKDSVFYYDGSKQKIKGKLFNVFVICTLSILYIIGECNWNGDVSNNQNINMKSEHAIHLNSIKEKEIINNSIWFYLSKIILIIIFVLIIPLIKGIGQFFEMIVKRYYKKNENYYNYKYR